MRDDRSGVNAGIVIAAGWAWRLLVLAALLYGLYWLVGLFSEVTVPIAISFLFAAALFPIWAWLTKKGVPNTISALAAVTMLVVVVVGILTGAGAMVVGEIPQLAEQTVSGVKGVMTWLADGPLRVNQDQINAWVTQFTQWASNSQQLIASYAAKLGSKVGTFLAGTIIALITTFFFLKDGRKIFSGVLTLVPEQYRGHVTRGCENGWKSLVLFMGAAVTVAFVDAVGVLIACLLLQTPLPWAIFALTFIASFVPIVGAFIAGFVAVLLTLITHGPVSAVIMLVAVVLVMNLESSFLQPFLLGRAVSLHPLAVLFGLAIGASVGGIVGAVLAGPLMAFVVSFIRANTNDSPPVEAGSES